MRARRVRWRRVAVAVAVAGLVAGGAAAVPGSAASAAGVAPVDRPTDRPAASPFAAALSAAFDAAGDGSELVTGTVPDRPYPACANTDGVPFATGLEPLRCASAQPTGTPVSSWNDYGAVFTPVVQTVGKAKLSLHFPPLLGRIENFLCSLPTSCPAGFSFHLVPDTYFVAINGYVTVQSPTDAASLSLPGAAGQPQYGVLLRQRVQALAFGALPIDAVVTVTQPFTPAGAAVPLTLSWAVMTASKDGPFEAGQTLPGYFAKYGGAPFRGAQIAEDLTLSGAVRIQVSDLRLDGVPIDVGNSCHADTTLDVMARGGWQLNQPATAHPGEQGEYNPFYPPGYLHGNVVVPAFSGCTDGHQDLDPLVTGTVSSSDNPTELTQGSRFNYIGCLVDDQKRGCTGDHPAVVDPAKVPIPEPPSS